MIINYSPLIIVQTYIVAGGYYFGDLSSTEVLVETGSAWTLTGELPSPRSGLRGANIDNKIVMTGKGTIQSKKNKKNAENSAFGVLDSPPECRKIQPNFIFSP